MELNLHFDFALPALFRLRLARLPPLVDCRAEIHPDNALRVAKRAA
jgi:hypothetical protein